MNTPQQIRPGQMYQGSKPVRDREYLRFIKRLPCVSCLKTWWIDPAHTGPHALGQKSSDLDTIPLCRNRKQESNHWWTVQRVAPDISTPLMITVEPGTAVNPGPNLWDACGQDCALKIVSEQMGKVTS
jgi:hypothetical protein